MRSAILYSCLAALLWSCGTKQEKPKSTEKKEPSGRELSQTYCVRCHAYPEPNLLDKATWEKAVLPKMGLRYGIYKPGKRKSSIEQNEGGEIVEEANVFPKEPILEPKIWRSIEAYYLKNAPAKLETNPTKVLSTELPLFEAVIPSKKFSPPSTSMVLFDSEGNLTHADALGTRIRMFDENLKVLRTIESGNAPCWVKEFDGAWWVTNMGQIFPTDQPLGSVVRVDKKSGSVDTLVGRLKRPVHTDYADVNGDDRVDLVVSEFGSLTGALKLLTSNESGGYDEKLLRDQPGATKAHFMDMDKDGKLDIVALFAQGDEGISIFYNKGDGSFREDKVLRFPPSYGTAWFEMRDLNEDGVLDILYAAGDNADYTPIMKPYHGIYGFINDGNNQFKQKFFQHLNGAYGAAMRDFDKDGDMDMAAISFFPDWQNNPAESFVYFENQGNWRFKESTFEGSTKGRWILINAGDYDKDGDEDIILGSMFYPTSPSIGLDAQWHQDGIPFIVLENKLNP